MLGKVKPADSGIRASVWFTSALFLCICITLLIFSRSLPKRSRAKSSAKNSTVLQINQQPRNNFVRMDQIPLFRSGSLRVQSASFSGPASLDELVESMPPTSDLSIQELIECLHHPSPALRLSAVQALSKRGQQAFDAVPDLKKLYKDDPEERIRRLASDALINIRLYDFGPKDIIR
jgi:hypothetical protein